MNKKSQRSERGRSVFLLRDSGGEHEMTPGKYVEWAQRVSKSLGLKFSGTAKEIKRLMRERVPVSGDLFFDYCVSGDLLSRPALDACRDEIRRDLNISHLLIPRRDRLARPGDASDAVRMENELRHLGVTLMFLSVTLDPLKRGQRQDVDEAIASYIDYHKSGEFLDEHAEKMIYAHLELTSEGFSSGGVPPFGFQRYLVRNDGTVIRPLEKGEIMRLKGHHVAWLPRSESEINLIRRILGMLKDTPASQIARILTEEGIPSPGVELSRTDNGVKHLVSGIWHATTITGLARNPFITRAMKTYRRRSMGKHRRMTPEGPRPLEEVEFVSDTKTKVITNPNSSVVSAMGAGGIEPILSAEDADQLDKILDQRAGTQRGKPRSRDPSRNPLGGRIYDLNCTWPMYRVPYQKTFRYICGFYQQSHGQQCSHNHVDGPTATKLALAAINQRLLIPDIRRKLETKIRTALAERSKPEQFEAVLACKRTELKQAGVQLAKATENLTLAKTPELFQLMTPVVEKLAANETRLGHEVSALSAKAAVTDSSRDVLEEALRCADQLPSLAQEPEDFSKIAELFRAINLQLFVRFHAVQKAKRIEHKQSGGVLTWGDTPSPIEKYSGPTSRRALQASVSVEMKSPEGESPSGLDSDPDSGGKAESLGNGSRDDSRCTLVNETAGVVLVLGLFPQIIHFDGDAVTQLIEPGLYAKR